MRQLIAGILLFLCSAQISAQKNQFDKELYIGVGGGAFASSVDFSPSVSQQPFIGIHGGVSAKYISEKHLGLLVELNYAQRGWMEDFSPESGFSYDKRLNYLELPFMTHVYFCKKVRFLINAGPQLGFLLSSSDNMNDALAADIAARREADPDTQIGMQYTLEPRRFDYGLVGGVGMEVRTGAGSLQLEGRYYFGLGDIFENRKSKADFFFSRSAHRIIEAKLSYLFKVK